MAGCGCIGTCDCFIEGAGLVTVTGTGDVTDPYVVTGTQTDFDLTSLSNALVVTPGGVQGHAPSIDFAVDPAGTAPVSVTASGLKVDCCPAGAAEVSAEVCNDLRAEVDGLFADSGPTIVTPGTASLVSIATTGGTSGVSWSRSITNNESCDVLVNISGQPLMQGEITAGGDVQLNAAARLEITSAHTWVGGGTQRSQRVNYYIDSTDAVVSRVLSWIWTLGSEVIIPAGETLTVESYAVTQFRSFLDTAQANGYGYTFQTPTVWARRIRRDAIDVVGA